MGPFDELGAAIDAAWSRAARAPEAFPDVAAEALARAALHRRVGLDDLAAWLADVDALPPQLLGSGFGEPPIHAYAGDGWVLQVLCWVEGRTTVHRHDFAGAFTVLAGSSVQRRYRFTPGVTAGDGLCVGALERLDLSLLERGAVEPIVPGDGLIHSVFHLDRPTLSLVARTDGGLRDAPQYDYWPPAVAIDPEYADALVLRRTQLLAMMFRAGAPGAADYAARLLRDGGLQQTWRTLDLALGAPACAAHLPGLFDLAAARHGEAAEAMLASLRRARWEHAVAEQRRALADPAPRFLLGALLNAENRGDALALVNARHPGADASAWVRRCVARLFAGSDTATRAYALVADEMLGGGDDGAVIARLRARMPGLERVVVDLPALCGGVREGPLRPMFFAAP